VTKRPNFGSLELTNTNLPEIWENPHRNVITCGIKQLFLALTNKFYIQELNIIYSRKPGSSACLFSTFHSCPLQRAPSTQVHDTGLLFISDCLFQFHLYVLGGSRVSCVDLKAGKHSLPDKLFCQENSKYRITSCIITKMF
jgi:hypothetical protein